MSHESSLRCPEAPPHSLSFLFSIWRQPAGGEATMRGKELPFLSSLRGPLSPGHQFPIQETWALLGGRPRVPLNLAIFSECIEDGSPLRGCFGDPRDDLEQVPLWVLSHCVVWAYPGGSEIDLQEYSWTSVETLYYFVPPSTPHEQPLTIRCFTVFWPRRRREVAWASWLGETREWGALGPGFQAKPQPIDTVSVIVEARGDVRYRKAWLL